MKCGKRNTSAHYCSYQLRSPLKLSFLICPYISDTEWKHKCLQAWQETYCTPEIKAQCKRNVFTGGGGLPQNVFPSQGAWWSSHPICSLFQKSKMTWQAHIPAVTELSFASKQSIKQQEMWTRACQYLKSRYCMRGHCCELAATARGAECRRPREKSPYIEHFLRPVSNTSTL